MPLHLEVITPERKVYEEDVDMVVAPAIKTEGKSYQLAGLT